ncbi:hypothetical protein BCR44DRAFT_1140414 [Catenaria anguillulae PL171]|uniref:Coiled-coil domain-containing protein 39 n=1 Tax=Catenaria anguillulae PL171 TaxID=765915 RepID=A0A1Y2H3Y9_9FUNG|nr:hypothetical protein BCR44DRAFT_1140414 [Catenaria anguillulae PL171]
MRFHARCGTAANDVQAKRAEVQRLQEDVANKTQQQAAEEKRYAGLQAKLKQVMEKTGTKEEKAAELAEYLRQDEVRNKDLDKQIKALKDLTFKHNQDLFKLRQDEKTLHAEISGARAAIRNLTSKITRLDQESIAQRSLIYNQEYTLQQLERKVKRAQGDRSDEEQAALNAKIARLNEQLERAVEHHVLLSAQLKKAQDDFRHAKRRVDVLAKEQAGVTDQIDELNLYITSATAQLAAKIKDKEEVMVEAAVLKLEVKKLRGFMHARADEVLALESRQVQLQLALEERTHEIHLHKQMLKAQIRAAEDERYAAAAELRERQHQVELMKTRYEILMAQISGTGNDADEDGGEGGGGGGGEKSQAYYIIRAAQQRENLQRQGDDMDAKIQAAEKEIKAMENTLRLLNSKNDKFKSHLGAADVSPQDLEHKAYLQAQLDSALATLKHKQSVLSTLQQELAVAEQQLAAISAEEAREHTVVAQLVAQRAALDKQVEEAAAKKKRAEQVVVRLVKEIKAARGLSKADVLDEEVDMAGREYRDAANYALHKANEVLDRHLASYVHGTAAREGPDGSRSGQVLGGAAPRAMQRFQELMEELGIQPPSRPLTRVSSRAGGHQSPVAAVLARQGAGSRAPSRLAPTPSKVAAGHHAVGHGTSSSSPCASPVMLSMPVSHSVPGGGTSSGAGRMSPKVPAGVSVRRSSVPKGGSGANSPVHGSSSGKAAASPITLPLLPTMGVGVGMQQKTLSRAGSSVGSSRASSRAGSRASMAGGGGMAR